MPIRLLGVCLALAFLSGCGFNSVVVQHPDGSETKMSSDVYMATKQQEQAKQIVATLSESFQPVDGNLSAEGEVAEAMRKVMAMVLFPQIAESLQSDGYWNYQSAKLNFWGRLISNPLNTVTERIVFGKKGAYAGRGGYTEINFGNRVAKGSGGSGGGEGGGGSGSSASGDTSFEDFIFSLGDKSPVNIGDGTYITGKDSQFQSGDGVQGQAFTDPPNLQQPESNVSIDSGTGVQVPDLP